jgi:hypothetical protein
MNLAPFSIDAGIAAARQQRVHLRFNLMQLGLLVLAAIASSTHWATERPAVDWSGIIAATFFGVGLLMRIVAMQRKDEEAWYLARNAAEVSKSLCFQYAFGGLGYDRGRDATEVTRRFIDAFASIGRGVLLDSVSPRTEGYSEITEQMRTARALPFADAKREYARERIADQERYYSTRAAFHLRRSRLWMLLMLVAQVLGLFLSLLKAVTDIGSFGGVIGILSALAAAFVAWSQLRQHAMLAGQYQGQAMQLRDFARRIDLVDEPEWAGFVSDVENSIIAEHTRWVGLQGKR